MCVPIPHSHAAHGDDHVHTGDVRGLPAAVTTASPRARAEVFPTVPVIAQSSSPTGATTVRADQGEPSQSSQPLGGSRMMGETDSLETSAVRREVELLVQEELQSRLRSMSSEQLLQTLDGLRRLETTASTNTTSPLLPSPLLPSRSATNAAPLGPRAATPSAKQPTAAPSSRQTPPSPGVEAATAPEASSLYDGPSWRDFLGASTMDPARAAAAASSRGASPTAATALTAAADEVDAGSTSADTIESAAATTTTEGSAETADGAWPACTAHARLGLSAEVSRFHPRLQRSRSSVSRLERCMRDVKRSAQHHRV